jgi:hypothetical protein
MAKPRIFISSTFYDLKQTRIDISSFLEQLGYETVRNEEGDIAYGKEEALEDYCYREIEAVDILISIIGGRFGSESKKAEPGQASEVKKLENSVTQTEIKTALQLSKQVYIFIDHNVLSEYETYLLNKGTNVKFKYVDDIRIYQFIEEIKQLKNNNNIKGFESVSDITRYLQIQLSGLFKRFLQEQSRIKEINLINKLESTAQTLNKLVNYISDDNKDKSEEINKILMISHPLIDFVKENLKIKYNIYFEGIGDLTALLKAYGYKIEVEPDELFLDFWKFTRTNNDVQYTIELKASLFDDDKKLKFCKRSDWSEELAKFTVLSLAPSDDDLPF